MRIKLKTTLLSLFIAGLGSVTVLGAEHAAAATPSSTTPCVSAPAPAQWKHVVVLMFENKTYGQVIGSTSAPYISNLTKQCGTYTSWKDANYTVSGTTNGSYNSKPNYTTLTSGVSPSVHGLKDDTYSTTTAVDNIYNQLRANGKTGKDYYSGAASATPCAGSNFSGAYHDAIRYYSNLGSSYCNTHDVPLSTFMTDVRNGALPEFSMILPTNGENMHDNSISTGDTWAKNFLTPLLDSAQYKSGDTAIFFLWDEDTSVPNVLIAPSIVTGSKVPAPVGNPIGHFSALRTWNEMLGLPLIGNTGSASSLLSFYNGTSSVTPPPVDNAPAVSLTSPSNGTTLTTSPVTLTANATDDIGVTKVEFYDGATLIGADTSSPYSVSWNVSGLAGSRNLTAKAFDSGSHVTTSASIAVTVSIATTPTCSTKIVNPIGVATQVINTASAGTYHVWSRVMAPDTTSNSYYLQIDAACPVVVGDSSSIPANTWTWIDYQDANTASHTTANMTTGSHTITMTGRESSVKLDRVLFLSASCTPIADGENCADTIAPTNVAITSPAAGKVSTGTQQLAATASDGGQSGIAKVDFYIDGNLIGTTSTTPYQLNWNSTTVADGSHSVKVIATDVAGNSATSAAVSFTVSNADKTAPSTPANLAVTNTAATEVDLQWSASTDNVGVAGYNILRNGVLLTTSPVTTTTYRDTSVTSNTGYTYSVSAVDKAGNASQLSNTVSVTTPRSTDTASPSAPTNLTASITSSTSIGLTWSASTDDVGVAGYRILRNGTVITSTTAQSYVDATALPATSYSYGVVAYDAAGNVSPISNFAPIKLPSLSDTAAPSAPTYLTSHATSSQVTLDWTPSTDNVTVAGYTLYRNGAKLGTTISPSYADATVTAGQNYTYYVVAYDAASNVSANSNQVTVAVPNTSAISNLYIGVLEDTTLLKATPSSTHGFEKTMSVDSSPVKDMLLKFTIKSIGGRLVTSTSLRLWNTNAAGKTGGSFHPANSNNWSQSTANWNNAPAASSTILDSLGAVKAGTYYYVDLTKYIHADGTYSVRVKSAHDDGAAYATKEDSNIPHRPQLKITVQ